MFVIKRTDRGSTYVSRDGSGHSYTTRLEAARTWPTREAAQVHCCGNEMVVAVAAIVGVE
jgi:hypothetical protein